MIKVSIVIPIYNVEDYIEGCLLSVYNQTYRAIECILVDDCTPDSSISIAQKLIASTDSKIITKIVRHDVNRGLSAARNTGLSAATGEYVYFLDSDDEIYPYTIESMIQLCEKYPNVDLVQGSTAVFPDSNLKKWLNIKDKDLPEYSSDRLWIKKGLLRRTLFSMTAWNKLIRRKLLIDNNLYFKEGIIHEDEHWNFFIAKYVQSIAFCKQDTYRYRINDAGIMSEGCSPKSISGYNILLQDMCNNIDDLCINEQKRCILDLCLNTYNKVNKNKDLSYFIPQINNRVNEVKKLYITSYIFQTIFFLNKIDISTPGMPKYFTNKILQILKKFLR